MKIKTLSAIAVGLGLIGTGQLLNRGCPTVQIERQHTLAQCAQLGYANLKADFSANANLYTFQVPTETSSLDSVREVGNRFLNGAGKVGTKANATLHSIRDGGSRFLSRAANVAIAAWSKTKELASAVDEKARPILSSSVEAAQQAAQTAWPVLSTAGSIGATVLSAANDAAGWFAFSGLGTAIRTGAALAVFAYAKMHPQSPLNNEPRIVGKFLDRFQ